MVLYKLSTLVMKTNDYSKLFLWNAKLYFMITFLWPEMSLFKKTISLVCNVSIITFVCCGFSLYIKANVESFDRVINVLTIMMLQILVIFKTIFLWYKSEALKSIFSQILKDFWPYNLTNGKSTQTVIFNYKLCNIFTVWFVLTGASLAAVYFLAPAFNKEPRTLPYYETVYPFDWKPSPIYEILYFLQTFSHGVSVSVVGTAADFLVLGLLLSISSQYSILKECFEAFNTPKMYYINKRMRELLNDGLEEKYHDEKKEYFVRCVNHHHTILTFMNNVNNVLNPAELSQLTISVLAFCLGAFTIVNLADNYVQMVVGFLYISGFTLQLSVDCFFGTFLYHEASLLPEAIFHSNWKTLDDKRLRHDFLFLLFHAQRIPQFNAYNLYDMHMISYIKVLKMAFSFYTVLSTLK